MKSKTCRRHQRSRDRPEVTLHGVAVRIAGADEHPKEHTGHVGVEDGGALPEREAADGAGRIGADALEREECSLIGGELAAIARDGLVRDGVQSFGPDVVPSGYQEAVTSSSGAAASASRDGYFVSHSWYLGFTRSTWVC